MSTPLRVLIVDDDASQRRLIEFWLQEDGYATTTVGDGLSGWQSFEEQQPSLVISDIRMPGMSGLDLLNHIKATNLDVPVILITAFGTVNDAVDAVGGVVDPPPLDSKHGVPVQRALLDGLALFATPPPISASHSALVVGLFSGGA